MGREGKTGAGRTARFPSSLMGMCHTVMCSDLRAGKITRCANDFSFGDHNHGDPEQPLNPVQEDCTFKDDD
jgi:hypothetical protein